MSTHVRSGICIKLTKDSPKLFDVQLLYIFLGQLNRLQEKSNTSWVTIVKYKVS